VRAFCSGAARPFSKLNLMSIGVADPRSQAARPSRQRLFEFDTFAFQNGAKLLQVADVDENVTSGGSDVTRRGLADILNELQRRLCCPIPISDMSNFDLPVRIGPAAHDIHPEKPRVECLSRDNLDENGGGNQSLKRRPVARL
jgi:hypothetical protein